MSAYDADRRSFMQLAGIAGGTALASNAATATDESEADDEPDERPEYDGTVVQVLSMSVFYELTEGRGVRNAVPSVGDVSG